MKRLLYLGTLSLVATLMLAPAALAQTTGVNPILDADDNYSGDVVVGDDTPDCVTPEQALPSGLCSDTPITTVEEPAPAPAVQGTSAEALEAQYGIEPGTGPLVGGPAIEAQVGEDETLPDTGGPALLLPAAGLLLATGLIGMRMVRHRS